MVQTTIACDELQYLDHLGLNQNPFPVAPDDENFYMSTRIDQILTNLVHGIITRKGFMILTGDIGLGKTTISRRIIRILEKKGVETSLVFHTNYQDVELLKEINRDFGLEIDSLLFSDQMKLLNEFLLERNRAQQNCAIIIDDAQNLDPTSLELIRMISNLETNQQKLVQILLIGQPELAEKLKSNELRQLESRIVIKETVKPLKKDELKNYLMFKLTSSGSSGLTRIDAAAVREAYRFTRGNFRKVNLLMDRCLYLAYFNNTQSISINVVKEAVADLAPGKPNRPRALPWPVTIGLCGLLVAGGLLLGSRYFWPDRLAVMDTQHQQKSTVAPIPETTATVAHVSIPAPTADDPVGNRVPEPVRKFLQAYGLTTFTDRFFEALQQDQFRDIAATIYSQTGYELIRLKRLPSSINQKYGVLTYPIDRDAAPDHFLFWRPKLIVNSFYYDYWGNEILELQRMLAKVDFYRYHLDGIVGKKLMRAIVSFQKETGLPVTGYPDKQTLFLLAHQPKG